jgi:hypothetical protein
MSGHFFGFASQNQKNGHSFKLFFGGASRQGSFETALRDFRPVSGALGRVADRPFRERDHMANTFVLRGVLSC